VGHLGDLTYLGQHEVGQENVEMSILEVIAIDSI